ncbi:hypothetical protein [Halorubellus litoreus]|uniref:Uncharacterized protein n=1 Tax=Halorubellus litoreus TaxID=755308 RepID=A0ABD5VBS2_9EURY
MRNWSGRAVATVEAVLPSVRRRRREYARIDEAIAAQDVPEESFRCDRCERVQSRFAVGALAEADARTEVWCLDCVEHREEVAAVEGSTPGLGAIGRE